MVNALCPRSLLFLLSISTLRSSSAVVNSLRILPTTAIRGKFASLLVQGPSAVFKQQRTRLTPSSSSNNNKQAAIRYPSTSNSNDNNKESSQVHNRRSSTQQHHVIVHQIPHGGATETPPQPARFWQLLAAECFGTFLIVQIGTAAVMASILTNGLLGTTLLPIAFLWTMAVTLAITVTGPISGAHLNPAVTLALAVWRQFPWRHVLPYSGAQVVGAVLAATVNFVGLYGSSLRSYEVANKHMRSTSVATAKVFGEYFSCRTWTAWGTEMVGTAVLASVIFALTHPKNSNKDAAQQQQLPIPLVIGATVGTLICILAPITQCGLNPARDFGPRIVAYLGGWNAVAFRKWWVYVTAPLVGAVAGGWIVDRVLYRNA